MELLPVVRMTVDDYIYKVIVPMYAEFDAAHKEDHAHTVIDQSMRLLDSMQQPHGFKIRMMSMSNGLFPLIGNC